MGKQEKIYSVIVSSEGGQLFCKCYKFLYDAFNEFKEQSKQNFEFNHYDVEHFDGYRDFDDGAIIYRIFDKKIDYTYAIYQDDYTRIELVESEFIN